MSPIRPLVVVEAFPSTVRKGEPLRVSARLYDRRTLFPLEVSRLFMQIISERDGHVAWPTEVVRKDAAGFDIEIGTGEMRESTTYLVRVSNNANMSPMGATTFSLAEGRFPFAVLIPLMLSPLFMRTYAPQGIETVGQLVAHLRARGLTDAQIEARLKAIIRDIGQLSTDQLRMPVDTARGIKYKVFRTQMDHRVCAECQSWLHRSSPGLPAPRYVPGDPDAPTLPIHPNCRCTFDLVYEDPAPHEAAMLRAALRPGRDAARFLNALGGELP